MFPVIPFIHSAIIGGTPLLFGATGEIVTEKSGNLNLGIPGIMYVGGISGVIGSFIYESSVTEINPILAVLIPLFIKKRNAAKDLDGFELLESNAGPEDPDEVIVIEQEK